MLNFVFIPVVRLSCKTFLHTFQSAVDGFPHIGHPMLVLRLLLDVPSYALVAILLVPSPDAMSAIENACR